MEWDNNGGLARLNESWTNQRDKNPKHNVIGGKDPNMISILLG